MDLAKLHDMIYAIELDPRAKFLAAIDRIVERELPADLPARLRAKLLDQRLDALAIRAKQVIEAGHFDQLDDLAAGPLPGCARL